MTRELRSHVKACQAEAHWLRRHYGTAYAIAVYTRSLRAAIRLEQNKLTAQAAIKLATVSDSYHVRRALQPLPPVSR